MLVSPLVLQIVECVYVLIYISWTYVRFLFSLLAAAVFRRVLSVWLCGDKNPHDFYLMDLNLEKHYVICKLFLNQTKLLRRAERGGSVLEIAEELRYQLGYYS